VPLPREIIDRLCDVALEYARPGSVGVVHHGGTCERKLALSFDDGPSPANTPWVLDILRDCEARATFFVVGNQIKGREALLERMVADGHEVGNHTYTHSHTIRLTRSELQREIESTNKSIEAITNLPVQLVRPPFGKDRRRIGQVAEQLGMKAVVWSIDSGDTGRFSAVEVAQRIVARAKPGAIVLFHDGGDLRTTTIRSLEVLLGSDQLFLEATTVGEVLASAG
jgi:peptidoglycan/xylan/chitin deacetylase (PgdA/CDA1 family)